MDFEKRTEYKRHECNCDSGPRLGGKVHDRGCAIIENFGAVMSFHEAREWVKAELEKVSEKLEEIKKGLYW
jgi:hypothetical protein